MRIGVGLMAFVALLAAGRGAPSVSQVPSPTILFLVAQPERFDGDSYVLPLRDPDAIAHARALVASGPQGLAAIAVARIDAGADGINRDHRADGKPLWSWHVTEFVEFADFTVELCDGTPTLVEGDVSGWLANTDSTVCFWSYTVVEELGPLATGDATWGAFKARYDR